MNPEKLSQSQISEEKVNLNDLLTRLENKSPEIRDKFLHDLLPRLKQSLAPLKEEYDLSYAGLVYEGSRERLQTIISEVDEELGMTSENSALVLSLQRLLNRLKALGKDNGQGESFKETRRQVEDLERLLSGAF